MADGFIANGRPFRCSTDITRHNTTSHSSWARYLWRPPALARRVFSVNCVFFYLRGGGGNFVGKGDCCCMETDKQYFRGGGGRGVFEWIRYSYMEIKRHCFFLGGGASSSAYRDGCFQIEVEKHWFVLRELVP